jgi:hypothetical protein
VNTITVRKVDLVAKVTENRDLHVAAHSAALDGWRQTVKDALREAVPAFERDEDLSAFNFAYKYAKPASFVDEYDRVLEMLEWETADDIRLSEDDFRHFIQDDWDWSKSFKMSSSQYTATASR